MKRTDAGRERAKRARFTTSRTSALLERDRRRYLANAAQQRRARVDGSPGRSLETWEHAVRGAEQILSERGLSVAGEPIPERSARMTECSRCGRPTPEHEVQRCDRCGSDGLGNCCIGDMDHDCKSERGRQATVNYARNVGLDRDATSSSLDG